MTVTTTNMVVVFKMAMAVMTLLFAAGNAQKPPEAAIPQIPSVVGLEPLEASLREQHTDLFNLTRGFAVRRGASFLAKVHTSAPVAQEADLTVVASPPSFTATVEARTGPSELLVRFSVIPSASVGPVQLALVLDLSNTTAEGGEGFEYRYPFPVYVLFNAWASEDAAVHLDNEHHREAYVLESHGLVFDGSLHAHRTIHWFYGPMTQVALEAASYLLESLAEADRGSAWAVSRHVSRMQGFHRQVANKLVGNEHGLLEGKWFGGFENGTDPDAWTSSIDILNQWKETGRATRYGQCFIFAALQTTLLRALGIPTRQLSAFGSRATKSLTVDSFYDAKGTLVHSDGKQWNYHSWNEVWLNNGSAEPAFDGWHTLDGTPPGLGPAPTRAVFDQNLDPAIGLNTTNFLATTHATVRDYLVECNAEALADPRAHAHAHGQDSKSKDPLEGCRIKQLLKYDATGVPLILTTQTTRNGTLQREDITRHFVDPLRDVLAGHEAQSDPLAAVLVSVPASPLQASVNTDGPVRVDRDLPVDVSVEGALAGSEGRITVVAEFVTNRGAVVASVFSASEPLVAGRGGPSTIKMVVPRNALLRPDFSGLVLRVSAHVTFDEEHARAETLEPLTVPAPRERRPGVLSFRNPHDFDLEDACFVARLKGTAEVVRHCQSLKARKVMRLPHGIDTLEMRSVAVHGPYLPLTFLPAQAHTNH